jgi:hypothetical protein
MSILARSADSREVTLQPTTARGVCAAVGKQAGRAVPGSAAGQARLLAGLERRREVVLDRCGGSAATIPPPQPMELPVTVLADSARALFGW